MTATSMMRRMSFEQGSDLWHQWRARHIGASDSAAILGVSPYQTAADIVNEKLHGVKQPVNYGMQRGTNLEPWIRARVSDRTGLHWEPVCAVSVHYPFLAASFDGVAEIGDIVETLEIKAPNKLFHMMALNGVIPEVYRWQLVHQSIVSGVNPLYCSYSDNDAFKQSDRLVIVRYQTADDEKNYLLNRLQDWVQQNESLFLGTA